MGTDRNERGYYQPLRNGHGMSAENCKQQMCAAGRKVARTEKAAAGIMAGNGPDDPRVWSQTRLRQFAYRLSEEGRKHHCRCVLDYAAARVDWGRSIEAYNNAVGAVRPKTPPLPPKPVYAKREGTEGPCPTVARRWVGRETMPPVEPWHYTTPPWEDGPPGTVAPW